MKILSLALSILTLFGSVPAFSLELTLPAPEKEYFIEAGDIINVNVSPADEFSKEVTVQPDGTIEIPLLGSLKASGLKADDLAKQLTAKFSKYVANPSITINVRKFASNKVAVIGQITSPGYYEYREGMRLLDLVAQASGPQDYARSAKVRIYRRTPGPDGKFTEQVIKADLGAVLDGKMDKNIQLLNGDIVYIPKKPFYKTAKWITDNFLPWATLFTFAVTASIVARKN
ncbi:MAG: polysaccharide biosynthesis/export family protein [Elusimicrobia bacterium]|jgi:polysaccharide export outer membrane protein|nr:polysaccharide biosynthesis/export family protein [Elusimicrobiota bacterium]